MDKLDRPFPGITVTISNVGDRKEPQRAVTDATGAVRFDGLCQGAEYSVLVKPDVGYKIEAQVQGGPKGQSRQEFKLRDLRADAGAKARVPTSLESDVLESVFRHQAAQLDGGFESAESAYYLTVLGNDPPPGFFARFMADRSRARPGSKFKQGHDRYHLSIYYVLEISDQEVEVGGGYYAGNLAAAGCTYRLRKSHDGRWQVVGAEEDWIS